MKRDSDIQRDVQAELEGSHLHGVVRSWAERDQALQTPWSAPGVTHVANVLTLRR
jgi:osmotically-inducible protein OsmY